MEQMTNNEKLRLPNKGPAESEVWMKNLLH